MRKMLRWAAVGATVATAGAVLSVAAMAGATTTPAKAATALSITAAKGHVVPGGADVIGGTLRSAGKGVPGEVVWLDKVVTVNGKPTLVAVDHKLTAPASGKAPGSVAFVIHPLRTTAYELAFPGDKTLAGSKSAAVIVRVAKLPTKLTASAAAALIKASATDVITGTLTVGGKALPKEPVTLSKEVTVNGKPKLLLIAAKPTLAGGKVTFTVKPGATATYVLIFFGDKVLAPSKAVVTVTVTK
jgi:hypothetical protein